MNGVHVELVHIPCRDLVLLHNLRVPMADRARAGKIQWIHRRPGITSFVDLMRPMAGPAGGDLSALSNPGMNACLVFTEGFIVAGAADRGCQIFRLLYIVMTVAVLAARTASALAASMDAPFEPAGRVFMA